MKDLASYFLLLLLTLPFAALLTDALGRTRNRMLPVALGVTALSSFTAILAGNLFNRLTLSGIFFWAILVWPVLLLAAKAYNPRLSWWTIWLSVPVMSWYLVNASGVFYYSVETGGDVMAARFGIFFGWLYMFIPFLPLLGLFLGGRALLRILRERRRTDSTRR